MSRKRLLFICLILFGLYAGGVLTYGLLAPNRSPAMTMRGLDEILDRTGGRLAAVQFTLVEPLTEPEQAERLRRRLGWNAAAPTDELRQFELTEERGTPLLRLTWELRGKATQSWSARYARLTRAMAKEGIWAPVHVQLESHAEVQEQPLLELVNRALDEVAAHHRQPWSDGRAASVAGWSNHLPPGPHEVNIQVAARQVGEQTRIWVAWPAMTGDY